MEDHIRPRPYQLDLYEKASSQNTIIYLPTGSGKTFISILLMKKYKESLMLPFGNGGKRAIFIVNTIPLVNQQSDYIQCHTEFTCKGYSGETNVDFWTKSTWKNEVEQHQVMVMTPQILVNILNHGVIKLEDINLMIFDECHHAVTNHPMRTIMQKFQNVSLENQPRVLGMSATLLNSNAGIWEIEKELENLETTFHAKIETVNSTNEVSSFSTNPTEVCVFYDIPEKLPIMSKINMMINTMKAVLNKVHIHSHRDVDKSDPVFKPQTKNQRLLQNLMDIEEHFQEAGVYGGDQGILSHLQQIKLLKLSAENEEFEMILSFIDTKLNLIRKVISDEMEEYSEIDKILNFSSDKILKLFGILKDFHQNKADDAEFCCIIFVERRIMAKTLCHVLQILRDSSEDFQFLLPGFVVGNNVDSFKSAKEDMSVPAWNRETLKKFRSGELNCLTATNVLDEGVDIPICTLIIRYSLPQDFRGYVQSKGRARHVSSQYVLLVDKNDDNDFLKRCSNFKATEEKLNKLLHGKTVYRIPPDEKTIEENLYKSNLEPYRVVNKDGFMSSVDENSSISLLVRYCTSLPKNEKELVPMPTWILHYIEDDMLYRVDLQLPEESPLKEIIRGEPMASIELGKKAVALKACIQLHKLEELNDNLLPKNQPEECISVEALSEQFRVTHVSSG